MKKYILITLIVLFFSPTIKADSYIVGHMIPFESEKLENPINLDCGLTIYEWRRKGDSEDLNRYCSLALNNFAPFIKKHKGIDVTPQLNFGLSLLRDSRKYRELNDLKYRFFDRQQQVEVWGYTSYDDKYIFITNDTSMPEFKKIFVHEVFHGLSMASNIFDSHPGDKYEKYKADEKLARKFTRELGLGE